MNNAFIKKKHLMTQPWWVWILGINIFFIMMTALFPYVQQDFLRWIVINHFNLAGEMTMAAWWSGILLLLSAAIAYDMFRQEGQVQRAWGIFALLFVLLSFDEIGSLHERAFNSFSGQISLLLAAVIGGSAFLYACWLLWQQGQDRKGVVFLLLGGALMASAVPQEYLEHNLDWPFFLEGARVAVEEGSELTGMLFCLAGLVRFRFPHETKRTIRHLLPAPYRLSNVAKGNILVLVLHLGISIWVAYYLTIGFQGNPAVFYFTAMFFLLSLAYFWQVAHQCHTDYYLNIFLGGYFMALSLGSMYFVLPRFNSKFHDLGILADLPVLLASQLTLLVVILYFLYSRLTQKEIALLIGLAAALWLGWMLDSSLANYIVSGLFAWVIAMLFWPRSKPL